MAKPKNGGVAAFQYDAEEQGEFIDKLQAASAKLHSILDHISGYGYEAFSESGNSGTQHGILWAAQGLSEEIRNISERLMTPKDSARQEVANG